MPRNPANINTSSVHVLITNSSSDDFVNCQTTLEMTHSNGAVVRWTLPDRLIQHSEVLTIALEEMRAELDERRRRRASA